MPSSIRRRWRLAVSAALVLSCVGTLAAQEEELRVGLIVPLTGRQSVLGAVCREGAELAVAEANRDGGLQVGARRVPVVLLVKDAAGRPEAAMSAAQELVNQEQATAIIGPAMSDTAIPVARFLDRLGIPMITQTASSPEVTRATSCVFRVCATDDFVAGTLARFAWTQLRARTAGLLYDVAGEDPRGIADFFAAEFLRLGGRVVREPYTTGVTEWGPALRRIKAARADVLLLPNYSVDLWRQLAQIGSAGLPAAILGTDTMASNLRAGAALPGDTWFTTHFVPQDPSARVRQFVASFQSAFKEAPVSSSAPLTYDAFQVLFKAVQKAGSLSAAAICRSVKSMDDFQGVTGTISFAGGQDPRKGVSIVHARGGTVVGFERVDP